MRTYVTPELFFESFELNQSIAACRWDMNQNDKSVCTAEYDPNLNNSHGTGLLLFTEPGRCTITPEIAPDFCYFNSTDGDNNGRLFMS